jgi:hypothetical protein
MNGIRIGQVVEYHGTMESMHGTYNVVRLPLDGADRGYWLGRGDADDRCIQNVHRDSITPMVEVTR